MSEEPNIPMATPVLGERELENIIRAVRSGWISARGPYVAAFEEAFSRYCGVQHGVAVTNGTAALHLALAALDLKPDDEVIVPTLAHIAAANAVTYTGARLVLADSTAETWTLDVEQVARKLSPRTRAVVAVHLYGHPVEMDPLRALAAQHGFSVVEDAAEAHGAEVKGRRAGSLGRLASFSFYANKIVTTGEGGMVVTDDEALVARARRLREHASSERDHYRHEELGFNYRMTNLQAALGVAQMERIEEFVAARRGHARWYTEQLQEIPGLVTPPEAEWAKSVYWMYSVLVQESFGISRDDLRARLEAQGIETRPFFHPVHQQPLYAGQFGDERYPVAERLSQQGLNLPSGNDLSEGQVDRIAAALRSAARR